MILSLESQARLFLLTILLGGGLGLVYDCLRLFRRTLPHKRLWVQVEDGVFWLCAVFFAFGIMLYANDGEIRLFTLLGMFGGMGLYFLTFSRVFLACSEAIVGVIKKVFGLLFTILLTPFRLFYLLIRKPLMEIRFFCAKQKKKMLHLCNIYVKIKLKALRRNWRIIRRKKKKGQGESKQRYEKEKKRQKKQNKKTG